MKKIKKGLCGILALTMCISVMTGCAANPDKGIVTSKNDGVFEQNMTVAATAPLDENLHYTDTFTSHDGTAEYTINLDQELTSDPLPIVEVVPHFFTGEEVKHIARVLFGDADFYEREPWDNPQYSKSQLQKKINLLSQLANKSALQELYGSDGSYDEEIELIQLYMQRFTTQMETAPDENPHVPCDWTFKSDSIYSDPAYGSEVIYATVDLGDVNYKIYTSRRDRSDYIENSLSVQFGDGLGYDNLERDYYIAGLCRTERPTEDQIAAVKEKAENYLEQMNMGDWSACSVEVDTDQKGTVSQYEITVMAMPVFNGVSALYGQPMGNLTSSDANASNYLMTGAMFRFSANGDLIYFSMDAPIDVKTVVNESAAILSVDELMEKAKTQLSLSGVAAGIGLPYGIYDIRQDVFGEDITCKITINEMGFGLARIKVPNTDYTYYYVPALVLYGAADYYGQYSGTYFEQWSVDNQDLVWINAVDGSIIGET